MNVLQSLAWYFPESSGGTEVYVSGMAQALKKYGVQSTILAGREGFEEANYSHEGLDVFRYPVSENASLDQVRGRVPYGGFEFFQSRLRMLRPDVYHQHTVVGGCGIHHLREARALGLTTVLTLHLPNPICLRGTMMKYGTAVCDGRIDEVRCAVCWGMSRGLPRPVAAMAARMPMAISRSAAKRPSTTASVLATPALVAEHKARLLELGDVADRIVAISKWLYDALLANGLPEEKIVLCQTGAPNQGTNDCPRVERNGVLRVAFLGRCDQPKGLDVLIKAMRRLRPEVPIQLTVHGLPAQTAGSRYEDDLRKDAARDQRIKFVSPLPQHEVRRALSNFDLIAIPSQCLETGPLVLLEAHAAGVPVLASNLGGLSERIRHEVDGWLVPATNVNAWSSALLRLAGDRKLLEQLQQGIQPVRTLENVAQDMASLYADLSQ